MIKAFSTHRLAAFAGGAALVFLALAAVRGIYSGNASSRGVLLKSSVDSRLSPALLVDPMRLRQILNNLVSNALKFTAKGHIEIKAELVERAGAHRDGVAERHAAAIVIRIS